MVPGGSQVSDIFLYFFFRLGGGEEEAEAPGRGRGSVLFMENSRKRGPRVSVGNLAGGAKMFFLGAEIPTKFLRGPKKERSPQHKMREDT